VPGAEVDQRVDGVEARVLGEGARDDFQRVGERLDGELLAAADGVGEVAELQRELGLGGAAAGQDLPVEQRRADDAERVLDGALDLVDDVFGAAAEDEGDGLRLSTSSTKMRSSPPMSFWATEPAKPRSSDSMSSRLETTRPPVARARRFRSPDFARRTARMPSCAR